MTISIIDIIMEAYKDILGAMHNHFGDTNAMHVSVYTDRYEIYKIIDSEKVAAVRYNIQIKHNKLVRRVDTWVTCTYNSAISTP